MQVDVFALLADARQRIAARRVAIEAQRDFWLASTDLATAVAGGGAASEGPRMTATTAQTNDGH
jgi:outer membrane protein TolC